MLLLSPSSHCHVLSPLHHWEHMEHNRKWVTHPMRIFYISRRFDACGFGCYKLPFSPSSHLSGWVPLLFHIVSVMCAVYISVILADDCHVFSPLRIHYWKHMEHNRKWIMHPHIFLWCMHVVACGNCDHCVSVFSFPPLRWWVPLFSTSPNDVCTVSDLC